MNLYHSRSIRYNTCESGHEKKKALQPGGEELIGELTAYPEENEL